MNYLYGRRSWVYGALALLLALDAAVYFGWLRRVAASPPDPAPIAALEQEVTERAGEVSRLARVREQAPQLGPQLDKFVSERVFAERTGSSGIAEELENAAAETDVVLRTTKADTKIDKLYPDLLHIEITLSIEGGYTNLLRFVEALERSPHFYLINQLGVGATRGGGIRLEMQLETFLRKGAS